MTLFSAKHNKLLQREREQALSNLQFFRFAEQLQSFSVLGFSAVSAALAAT